MSSGVSPVVFLVEACRGEGRMRQLGTSSSPAPDAQSRDWDAVDQNAGHGAPLPLLARPRDADPRVVRPPRLVAESGDKPPGADLDACLNGSGVHHVDILDAEMEVAAAIHTRSTGSGADPAAGSGSFLDHQLDTAALERGEASAQKRNDVVSAVPSSSGTSISGPLPSSPPTSAMQGIQPCP